MNLPQRLARGNQRQPPAHHCRDSFGEVGREIVERCADDAAKPACGHASLPGRFVDGHDAPHFQRCCRLVISAVSGGIAQHFKLRLDNLQLSAARVLLHLAIERDQLAGLELILQIGGIEPEAFQARSSLAHGELEDGHAAGAKQPRVANFADHGGHFAGTQFGNAAGIHPVFIAKGQIIQQIAHRDNALGGKNFRQPRTNPLDVLHGRGEFEHAELPKEC